MRDTGRTSRGSSKPRKDTGRRRILTMTLGLLVAVGFYLAVGGLSSNPLGGLLPGFGLQGGLIEDTSFYANRNRVSPLSDVDLRRLREQRNLVDELARRHVGTPLSAGHSIEDLRVLQELLDQQILKPDQTYELQALGVALGDVLAEQYGLEWVVVDDDLGRSRALRYGEGEDLVFPITMISKRVEAKVRFRVLDLYEKSGQNVDEFSRRAGGGRRIPL